MNFLKNLDRALDFETIEKTVAEKVATTFAEEFPERNKGNAQQGKVLVTSTGERPSACPWRARNVRPDPNRLSPASLENKPLTDGQRDRRYSEMHHLNAQG